MKFLSRLFGSAKNIDTIVETGAKGLYNGIDALVYTKEEKAQALNEAREVYLKWCEMAYDQNSIRSITRRWLAFMVVAPTMVIGICSGIAYPFIPEYAQFLFKIFQHFSPWAVGVLIFYFGPHLVGAIKK